MTYGIVVRDGANVPRTITGIQVRDETNTPRDISEMWVRDSNNVPRLIFALSPPMSVVAAPNFVSGTTFGTGVAQTNSCTATPSGGVPPFSYLWQVISYDGPVSPGFTSPLVATTAVSQTSIGPSESYTAIVRCRVTDSSPVTPQVVYSNDVTCFWIDLS